MSGSSLTRRAFTRRMLGSAGVAIGLTGVLAACGGTPAPSAPATSPSSSTPAQGAAQAPSQQQLQHITLTLPWIPTGEVAFFYAAKQLGYWQQRGLDVDIQRGFGSGTAAKQTGLGQFDFAQADMGAVLSAIVEGLDLVSIGVTSPKHPAGVFSLAEANITQPKDLEGRSIGNTSGSATAIMLEAFMIANGVDRSKVRSVNLNGDVLVQSMINREVDATANFFQNAAPDLIVDGIPFNLMLFADYGLNVYSLTMATQGSRVREQPDLVQRFIDGTMEGLKYSYLEPDRTNEIFLEMVPEAGQQERDKQTNRISLLVNNAMGIVPSFEQNGLGYHDLDTVRSTIEILGGNLNWQRMPDPQTAVTNQFVGKVKLTPAEWEKARSLAKDFIELKPS